MSISEALAAAQAEFPAITKDRTANAGTYSYKYADLNSLLSAVRPILAKHEIALTQPIEITEEGAMVLATILWHGAETIESRMLLPIEGIAPQQVGSLLTYYRRYSLGALVGIAPEDDDDGAGAQATVRHAAKKASAKQIGFADKLIAELVDVGALGDVMQRAIGRVCDTEDLTTPEASALIDFLQDAKKKGDRFTVEYPEGEEPF